MTARRTGRPVADRFGEIAAAIEDAAAIESRWRLKDQFRDDVHIPFIPFPLPDRIAMLAEAAPLIPRAGPATGPWYLEPGCAAGSGMVIARRMFGMDVHGFELNKAMAEAGGAYGLDIEIADAGTWTGYAEADFVWYNRVFRDPAAEEELERRIWAEMAPGAVLACVNTAFPAPSDWIIILDAWRDEQRGIWLKPPLSRHDSC
jgi:hypothetical protein